MKTKFILGAFLFAATTISAQTNLLTDGGLETPAKNFILNNSGGNKLANNGKWFITFAIGGCEGGCCEGSAEFTTADKKEGNSSLKVDVVRQTNRNDIKLFQTIKGLTAGVYEVSMWAKSDKEGYPIALDVLKGTQAATNSGADPFTGSYTTTTEWKQYKFKVDVSAWTPEELDLLRISIRPNTTKKAPEGPFPKTFWIDGVSFTAVK